MSDKKVSEFITVTHATESVAQIYLSRANGDLALALATYLSEQSDSHSSASPSTQSGSRSSLSNSSSRTSMHRAPRHNFATFSDLQRAEESPQPPSSNDDPEQFFTGGERSGLAVTNPNDPKSGRKNAASSLVDEIIKKAQKRAADGEIPGEPATNKNASASNQPCFTGRGVRLGSEVPNAATGAEDDNDDDDDDLYGTHNHLDGSIDNDEDEEGEGSNEEVVQRTMYFWRDGFSIDDGPLYRFDDPQNAVYLRAINMGRAPIELLRVNPQQPVDVKLVQKPDEEYVKPKLPPSLDNAGPGQRLGSTVTTSIQPSQSPPAQTQPQGQDAASANVSQLGNEGDAAVQLRLADGSARRLRFDSQGAVQQLYDYVDMENRSGRAYVLQTPMPPRKLEDKQQSLTSAGVVGAVVVQRWI